MVKLKLQLLTELTKHYHDCALWVEDLTPNKDTDDLFTLSQADCLLFLTKMLTEFGKERTEELLIKHASQIGHDFYLTRNGHGSGFWDSDRVLFYGERDSIKLTELAKASKEDYKYTEYAIEIN